MSNMTRSRKLLIKKSSGQRVIENEEKDSKNEEDDDIQNIDHLENNKLRRIQTRNNTATIKASSSSSIQDISLIQQEKNQPIIQNSRKAERFKQNIRNKSSNSSDSDDLTKSSSNDSNQNHHLIQKQQQHQQQQYQQQNQQQQQTLSKNQKQQDSILQQPNIQVNIKSSGSNARNSSTSFFVSPNLNHPNLKSNPPKYDKTISKKQKKDILANQKHSDSSEVSSDDYRSKRQSDKVLKQNEKENQKMHDEKKDKNQQNKEMKGISSSSNIVKVNELFQQELMSSNSRREQEALKIQNNARKNKQQQIIIDSNEEGIQVEDEDDSENESQSGQELVEQIYQNRNNANNSFQASDCGSMQPQGANSSPIDSRSLSIGNLDQFIDDEDNDEILDSTTNNPKELNQKLRKKYASKMISEDNEEEEEEESDMIDIKFKKNGKKVSKMIEEIPNNKKKEMKNHKIEQHETQQQKNQKNNAKISASSSNSNISIHISGGNKNKNTLKPSDLKDLKGQMVNENGSEILQDISKIEEELFEVNELPKDKTRVLWIFNSVHFIEKLTNNQHVLEGQEIYTQNGKKWMLELSYNENEQQIECVFRRKDKEDTSKYQLYYVFKFYAISKTESFIDKSYNGNKTFSYESASQSFSFPLDIELVLDKYQHIIFELTLTPVRIQHYNSKEETNYVGLLNEGQTCYMNSYLQTLFHIKAFVKLVYSIPTEREFEPIFPHSLQVLFYQLQSRGYHCTTTDLLKSFSWDRSKARIQQDVQEFSCLFIEYLESKAEKIPQLKGQIKHLFQGRIQNYIKCINVDYESVKDELFFEISLNLKGCNDIYKSLDDYVKEEVLEGDNKYDTGHPSYKRQDAKKGIKIVQLPPVLFFHLKRFEFDYQSGRNMKIVDQHEYYEDIDMEKYIGNPNKKECYKYSLFAVLVHSGDMSSSGHYYAYIRPNPTEQNWFKFNDAIVERASKKQVLDHSFGGKSFFKGFDKNKKQLVWENTSINSTAYMLVYINQKEIGNIVGQIPLSQVPNWVIEQENELIQQHLLKLKLSKVVQVRMTSFDLLKKQQQSCAVYFQKQTIRDEQAEGNENIIYNKEVDKSKTYGEFYNDLCLELGVEPEDIILWKIDYLPNGFERIINLTKKMSPHSTEPIEKAYFDTLSNYSSPSSTTNQNNSVSNTNNNNLNNSNSTNNNSNSSLSGSNSALSPVILIIPISNARFGSNKTIFQQGQDGKLEIRKQNIQSSSEKKGSTSMDWNKYFQFQDGTLMLIIIKNFEYTKEGVKIQFMEYFFFKPDSNFSSLCEEITKKKKIDFSQCKVYKEEQYSITQIKGETHGNMNLKNLFNSTDCGVLVIAFESKLAKDHNISITSYYSQLQDSIRVRFIASPFSISNTNPANSMSIESIENTRLSNKPNSLITNNQENKKNLKTDKLNENKQSERNNENKNDKNIEVSKNDKNNNSKDFKPIEQNHSKKTNKTNPFLPGSSNNLSDSIENKNLYQTDSIQFLKNHSLQSLLPVEGIQFEKIFLKNVRYSQLQMSLFYQLKEYFKEQLNLINATLDSPQANDSSNNNNNDDIAIKSSNLQMVNRNHVQSKKSLQNMNVQAIEQFLNLEDSFYEFIYFRCKMRKRNIEEISYFQQSGVNETSLVDLLKHFDSTVVLHFDFSKALRARDRDQKLIIDFSLYSNTFNKIYPNQAIDIEKAANILALSNLLKSQKFFKDFFSAEVSQQGGSGAVPSQVKVCQLWKDNPNRIELYFSDSTKLNTIKKNSLIRIEIQKEIQESEIFFICHQTTRNGAETFDSPFSFPLSIYKQVKELKNRVVQILTDRTIFFDGKKIELNKDSLNIILYSEYSKYDSASLIVDESNDKLIKNEIDTDSFKKRCAFLEIQHSSIISSTDNKAIKFDIN